MRDCHLLLAPVSTTPQRRNLRSDWGHSTLLHKQDEPSFAPRLLGGRCRWWVFSRGIVVDFEKTKCRTFMDHRAYH